MINETRLSTQGSKYMKLADYIKALIASGSLGVGDKIPSLRVISEQQGIAIATALKAYQLLEDQQVIFSRPKSGYFVCRTESANLYEPEASKLSPRAKNISISQTLLQLLQYAASPEMAPLGCAIPCAKLLSVNRLDRFLSRAARRYGAKYNVYSTPQGEKPLRQAIANRGLVQGQRYAADDIVVTSGCTEALVLGLKAIVQPGDTVAVESPTYFGVLQVLESLNLKVFELPTCPKSGVDRNALASALENSTVQACLFSSSFSNPLGFCASEQSKLSILELLRKHRIPLVEDDIYGELFFGDKRPRTYSSLDTNNQVIYCSSFSKTIAPGYRVGWVVPGRLYHQIVLEKKMAQSLCCPVLPQIAIAEYLSEGGYDVHLRRVRKVLQTNVNKMRNAVCRYFPEGTKISNPGGGCVLWVQMMQPFDSRELLDRALQNGICFAPGDVFSAHGHYQNCFRLSCGHLWTDAIEQAVESLGAMAKIQYS